MRMRANLLISSAGNSSAWACWAIGKIRTLTLNKEYEADELRLFADIVEKGFVYRGKKPVYWSIPCRTALAEAEVEYKDHVSQSVLCEISGGWAGKDVCRHLDDDAVDFAGEPGGRVQQRFSVRQSCGGG